MTLHYKPLSKVVKLETSVPSKRNATANICFLSITHLEIMYIMFMFLNFGDLCYVLKTHNQVKIVQNYTFFST